MSPEDYSKLRKQLELHEGRRRFPYRCTAGKLSIGCGYNIDDRGLDDLKKAIAREVTLTELYTVGITDAEIDRILDFDIAHFEARVRFYLPEFDQLDSIRQRVVIDFAFNLGKKALGFHNAIAALKSAVRAKNLGQQKLYFTACAYHMTHSLWATQVGDGAGKRFDRADRLSEMMRTGEDYTK